MQIQVVDSNGVRLDVFLASVSADLSRSMGKNLILKNLVWVNGSVVKPNFRLKVGDEVRWSVPAALPLEPEPESITLDVLYEDDVLLVLNKPPGMVVHPAPGNETGTLLNALLFYDSCFGEVERAGIVHRLDKDTSGVLLVAKTEQARLALKDQFKNRETQKEYLALVWGTPPACGRIENQIGRHPKNRKKMAVLKEGGRLAISTFEVLERFEKISLLRVRIETGRTHQIRVHLAHLGFPVVGDRVYGRARKFDGVVPDRQMLHAEKLGIIHPFSKKKLLFNASLFYDMCSFLDTLRDDEISGSNIV